MNMNAFEKLDEARDHAEQVAGRFTALCEQQQLDKHSMRLATDLLNQLSKNLETIMKTAKPGAGVEPELEPMPIL
jgi:hypothetical protein